MIEQLFNELISRTTSIIGLAATFIALPSSFYRRRCHRWTIRRLGDLSGYQAAYLARNDRTLGVSGAKWNIYGRIILLPLRRMLFGQIGRGKTKNPSTSTAITMNQKWSIQRQSHKGRKVAATRYWDCHFIVLATGRGWANARMRFFKQDSFDTAMQTQRPAKPAWSGQVVAYFATSILSALPP